MMAKCFGVWNVLVLILLSALVYAKYPKHIPRFAFDRHSSPLNVPLVLNVILVNFAEDVGELRKISLLELQFLQKRCTQ